jgi:hypothetical protein
MTALLISAVMAASIQSSEAQPPHEKFRHRGCNTHRCDRRMDRRAHATTVARWKRVVRPHDAHLNRIAWCESTFRWHLNTGNGFYGGLQFTRSSWRLVGGRGMPHWASKLEQKFRAVKLSRVQGWGAWPVCG